MFVIQSVDGNIVRFFHFGSFARFKKARKTLETRPTWGMWVKQQTKFLCKRKLCKNFKNLIVLIEQYIASIAEKDTSVL